MRPNMPILMDTTPQQLRGEGADFRGLPGNRLSQRGFLQGIRVEEEEKSHEADSLAWTRLSQLDIAQAGGKDRYYNHVLDRRGQEIGRPRRAAFLITKRILSAEMRSSCM
jgi:hypothetical protein